MANGSSSGKSSRSSKEGARSKKDVHSSTPQLCRRRESHPLCSPSRRRFSGSYLESSSSTVPSVDWGNFLTLEMGAHPPGSPCSPRSPRSRRSSLSSHSMRPPLSPRLSRSPRRAGPCGRRASCDWMVEMMGGGAPCRQGLSEVCNKVLQHVSKAMAADQCSFALVTDDRAGGRGLSGVVFRSYKEDSHGQGQLSWEKSIMEHVVATGKSLNIKNVFEVTTAGHCPELPEIFQTDPAANLTASLALANWICLAFDFDFMKTQCRFKALFSGRFRKATISLLTKFATKEITQRPLTFHCPRGYI